MSPILVRDFQFSHSKRGTTCKLATRPLAIGVIYSFENNLTAENAENAEKNLVNLRNLLIFIHKH